MSWRLIDQHISDRGVLSHGASIFDNTSSLTRGKPIRIIRDDLFHNFRFVPQGQDWFWFCSELYSSHSRTMDVLAFNSVLSLCYSLPQLTQDQNTSLYVNWVFVFFVLMIRYKTNYRNWVKLLSWRKPGWWIIETKRSSHAISFLSSTSSSRTRRLQSTFPLQFSRVSNDQKPVEFGQLAVSRGHIGLHG